MVSPRNRHCANCIGALSFRMKSSSRISNRVSLANAVDALLRMNYELTFRVGKIACQ